MLLLDSAGSWLSVSWAYCIWVIVGGRGLMGVVYHSGQVPSWPTDPSFMRENIFCHGNSGPAMEKLISGRNGCNYPIVSISLNLPGEGDVEKSLWLNEDKS